MVLSTSASTLTPFAPSFPQSGLSYRSTGCVKPSFFTEAGPNPLISSILIKYSKNFIELILLLSSTISLGPSLFVLAPMARSAVSLVTFWLCIECSTTLKNLGITPPALSIVIKSPSPRLCSSIIDKHDLDFK